MKLKLFLSVFFGGLFIFLAHILYISERVSAWEMTGLLLPVGALCVFFVVLLKDQVSGRRE